ncbi:nuclear transport factor 2 family protein [Spongiibacter taiwanensis]|uniref:nuclear transport factor 2 family protein n=1 Tax=Spongiibacter taiwanensis TaxID=1748242 RepID=UPI002035828B|nr:nuclear transport factor 2 family protein [Spongiibacter taiwanensis]USA42667.1 nuclear transport factor 2 family protein [Spongiibacter taiwanensis]
MSIEHNKQQAVALLSAIESGIDIRSYFTDDARWRVVEGCPLSGDYAIADLVSAMGRVFGLYKYPPRFRIEHVTAEENRVAIYCRSSSELIDGSPVDNEYHFLMLFKGGLIDEVREFLNTARVIEIMPKLERLMASAQHRGE